MTKADKLIKRINAHMTASVEMANRSDNHSSKWFLACAEINLKELRRHLGIPEETPFDVTVED